ncbi:hypothetical protein MNBD_GAMMA22-672 [hydrothermal vent metagenome]|uniref:NAD(P)-binding domain-containing protein n=1 Tax=hydrothermal vent metagenome TaxID=652676 RepID=A0A3B1A4P0_9ZZZZ
MCVSTASQCDHSAANILSRLSIFWTIIRPSAFTDGELAGQYQHGFAATDKTTQLKISRADVADFMLKQFFENTYLHQSPGISY